MVPKKKKYYPELASTQRKNMMYLPIDRMEDYIIQRTNPSKSMEDLDRFPTYISMEPTPD